MAASDFVFCRRAQAASQGFIAGEFSNRSGSGVDIFERDDPAAFLAHEGGHATGAFKTDNRPSGVRRFQCDEREGIFTGWEEENVSSAQIGTSVGPFTEKGNS